MALSSGEDNSNAVGLANVNFSDGNAEALLNGDENYRKQVRITLVDS
jgi:hypothetical protein